MARAIDIGAGARACRSEARGRLRPVGRRLADDLISSLDQRVTLANPVAGYGSFRTNILFDDLGDSEQAPSDMALVADYTHLTALRAPRPTLLTYNATDDCCFKSGHTLEPLLAAARPIFALYGADDKLRSHVNHVPGTHNFEQENREKLYAAIGDFFYPDDTSFARTEICSENELKTAEELNVPLPSDNLDFQRPGDPPGERAAAGGRSPPTTRAAAESWQRERREALKSLLRIPNYEVAARDESARDAGEYRVTPRSFRCGESWTVPAVEIVSKSRAPTKTVILVADAGRASLAGEVARLAADGFRVLAVDPLLMGESKVKAQDPEYTYPLFLAAVGERPLGIQAAQLAAIARWARQRGPTSRSRSSATGPRASMATIVATAIEPAAIDGAEVAGALASLRQLIEDNKPVEELPELFAFGLLAEFDVSSLVALAAPRPVAFRESSERATRELAPLGPWYALFGKTFVPAR